MKSYFRVLFLIYCSVFFSSCFTNKMITKKPTKIVHNMEYTVVKVAQNGLTNNYGGPGYTTVKDKSTGKAGKFYLVEINFKNLSNSEKELDLTKICLCDINKKCLTPTRIDVKSIFDIVSKKTITFKPNELKRRELFFPGPKDFKPKYVLINSESNELIEFEYKK